MSAGALLWSGAALLVVGGVVGLAAGYKIEQTRTKDDVKKVKEQAAATANSAKAATSNSAPTGTAATTVRLAGKVGTTSPSALTITVAGKTTRVVTSARTVVVKASAGSPSDIKAGERVVWKSKPGQPTHAAEVIVLPANAKMGTPIVSATADSMTITSKGKHVAVTTSGATVEKVTTAKTTDITTGDKVVAQLRRTNQSPLSATEVIVLPDSSTFVA